MSGYRLTGGPFGEKVRSWKRWILVVDGEEIPFDRKRLALMCASVSHSMGRPVRLFEETKMRFVRGGEWKTDKKFRIDISDRIE